MINFFITVVIILAIINFILDWIINYFNFKKVQLLKREIELLEVRNSNTEQLLEESLLREVMLRQKLYEANRNDKCDNGSKN